MSQRVKAGSPCHPLNQVEVGVQLSALMRKITAHLFYKPLPAICEPISFPIKTYYVIPILVKRS
jgi:hypothetical protein